MKKELFKRILSSIALIPLVLFFIIKGSYIFICFILTCFVISAYEWHKISINKSIYIIGFFFLIFSFYTTYELRGLNQNYHYFLFVLSICVLTDVGGFIFGKIFKGPKLTKISPKKTYSGMVGGFILPLTLFKILYESPYKFTETIELSFKSIIFIVLVSSISQLGDLFISFFKRVSNVKDTGNIIPGHGGLLDRVDGMIFAFPFSYIILKIGFIEHI